MKKIWFLLLLLTIFIPVNVSAKEKDKVNIYIFYGYGCPHCEKAFEFFNSIEEQYGKYYNIHRYETWLWDNKTNDDALIKVATYFKTPEEQIGVPYIVIGDKMFLGYTESYNDDIINQIMDTYNGDNKDVVAPILNKHFNNTRSCLIAGIISIIALILCSVVNYLIRYTPKKMNS